ncbi:transglycosylase domain-containing protein [Tessaracoccus terricola]
MKSASLSQKAYAMIMFVAVSVLAGLLLAGLAVPLTALAGGATRAAADSLQYLPAELETPPQSERSKILMADGSTLATFYDENRIYVPLDKIAPVMQDAQIAIEDHRFYEHGAIDLQGLVRAFFRTASGDTQGASTLTQQYVKLVQVEAAVQAGDEAAIKAATETTIERKIREMRYAMAIEERMTKDEILEGYLNIAYYGSGAYGVEAAAHTYWGKTAAELTLPEAAMLAGIVQNPVQYDPARNLDLTIERRNFVLSRMADLGIISEADRDAAQAVAFDPAQIQRIPNGCVSSEFPHMCDYVFHELVSSGKMPSLGETAEQRENMLNRGGLTIRTLINPESQRAAEAAAMQQVAPVDPLIAGTVLIQPSTGLIVAMAQSRPERGTDPGQTWYNYMAGEDMGGYNGFQAGSTFKAFTIAAALEVGMTPSHQYNSPATVDTGDWTWKTCNGNIKLSGQPWKPSNQFHRGFGNIDMLKAAESSVNTYFVQLIRDVGVCTTVELADKVGVELANRNFELVKDFGSKPSFTLGTAEITPLSMAEAYATFANRGIHCEPIILESVVTQDGTELEVPSANCEQVIEPAVADGVTYILESVMSKGTGRPARMSDGRPQAGKTGTTNDTEAVWFAGYTPDMAGVAMIAADNGADYWDGRSNKRITAVPLTNGGRLAGTGGGDAGQIWKAAMGAALADVAPTEFTDPTKEILEGVKVPIPDTSGMSYNEAKAAVEAAGFNTARQRVFSDRREGTFLGTWPRGEATKFSTVALRVSAGPEPAPEPDPTPDPTPPASTPPASTPPQNTPPNSNPPGNTPPRGGDNPPRGGDDGDN